MKCRQEKCDGVALFTVFWPGQTTRLCAVCTIRAQNVAAFMGFNLDVRVLYEPPEVTPIGNARDNLAASGCAHDDGEAS